MLSHVWKGEKCKNQIADASIGKSPTYLFGTWKGRYSGAVLSLSIESPPHLKLCTYEAIPLWEHFLNCITILILCSFLGLPPSAMRFLGTGKMAAPSTAVLAHRRHSTRVCLADLLYPWISFPTNTGAQLPKGKSKLRSSKPC